jgi:hypothetical protein
MTHQVFKGWWTNVAKIAPRFQVGGGHMGVLQILLLLLGSYQGQGHYPTQRSAEICEKRKMPQRKEKKVKNPEDPVENG